VKDAELIFSPRFQLRKGTIWRNQEVRLNLEIPVGTKLILKQDAYRYVNNYWTWECNDSENDHNDSSIWIMTDDGLKCVAKLKEEALKKEKLEQELRDLDHLRNNKPTDTLYQDSVINRIKEVKEELGIAPE
jgi:hypothetical protein